MTISIRRMPATEANTAFGKVKQQQLEGKDLILAMALRIVRQRENLRSRTLVAHLKDWDLADLVRGPLNGQDLDEAVVARALALLSMEIEMGNSPRENTPAQRARWTRDRLNVLLEESQRATEEAKTILATRTNGKAA